MIQGLVLLFIGADVLILYLWNRRGRPRPRLPRFGRRPQVPPETAARVLAVEHATSRPARPPALDRVRDWALARVPRGAKATGIAAIVLALIAAWIALPPVTVRSAAVPIAIAAVFLALGAWTTYRGSRRLGITAMVLAVAFGGLGVAGTISSVANLESVVVWSALTAAMLRYATPLIFAAVGGMFSERSGVVNIGLEGMLLIGCFLRRPRRRQVRVVGVRACCWPPSRRERADARRHLDPPAGRPDRSAGTAVWLLGVGLTGYLFIDMYGPEGTPGNIPAIPTVNLGFLDGVPFFGEAFGNLNLMIWVGFMLVIASYYVIFRSPWGLHLRSAGEHPGRGDRGPVGLQDPLHRGDRCPASSRVSGARSTRSGSSTRSART